MVHTPDKIKSRTRYSNTALLYDIFIDGVHVGRVCSEAWERVPMVAPGYCRLVTDLLSDDGEKKVYKVHILQEVS